MTVSQVTRNLFNFFAKNDLFFLEKDFLSVSVPTGNDKEIDKQIIIHALKSFEAQGLVAPLKEHADQVDETPPVAWVLVKPLEEYSQNVEITFPTITAIAKIVNDFCEEHEIAQDKVDPLSITEQDLQNLILVYSNLKNSVESLDKE